MNTTQLYAAAARRIEAGATLYLINPDGATGYWPLARHHRLDDDTTSGPVLWVRPLVGGTVTETGIPAFPVGECRPRGIAWGHATVNVDSIRFVLASRQVLKLRPPTEPEREVIDRWDTFTETVLSAEDELALDELTDDSWWGAHV